MPPLAGASSCTPKGGVFNSRSGHVPRLWVQSPVGVHMEGQPSDVSLEKKEKRKVAFEVKEGLAGPKECFLLLHLLHYCHEAKFPELEKCMNSVSNCKTVRCMPVS